MAGRKGKEVTLVVQLVAVIYMAFVIYEEICQVLRLFLKNSIRQTRVIRKTVTAMDIIFAAKRSTIYART